jgi:hypothetical protein
MLRLSTNPIISVVASFRFASLRNTILLSLLYWCSWCNGQPLLLSESFDATSHSTAAFNSMLSEDQSEFLAPPDDTIAGYSVDHNAAQSVIESGVDRETVQVTLRTSPSKIPAF